MVKLPSATVKPRILSVNIKARRLGYVIQYLNLFKRNISLTVDNVIGKLESWAVQHQKELEAYIDSSGSITKTSKHYPAKRYVELMQGLQLIKITGRSCRITKLGEPLRFLKSNHNNPFDLSVEQECYLLRRLLISDFDVLLPLFRLLLDHGDVPWIFKLFKSAFIDQLEKRAEAIGDIIQASEFRKRIDSAKRWTKEKKYLEHIIYPRINWLIDLKLFDPEILVGEKRLQLNEAGKMIFFDLANTYEEAHLKYWLENHFYEIFVQAHRSRFAMGEIVKLSDLSEEHVFKHLEDMLKDSFEKFSSAGTPFLHMSATTFLEYSCIKFLGKGIVAGFDVLKDFLRSIPGYRFKWEPVVSDGFITKV